jgi:hypothetical protein
MGYLLVAAAAAQVFNLNCSGILETTRPDGNVTTEAFSKVYRIDLSANEWCEDDCRNRFNFASIGPTQLTFRDDEKEGATGHETNSSYVNRETGEYRTLAASRDRLIGIIILQWKGTCERSAFTGWPSFTTKF